MLGVLLLSCASMMACISPGWSFHLEQLWALTCQTHFWCLQLMRNRELGNLSYSRPLPLSVLYAKDMK